MRHLRRDAFPDVARAAKALKTAILSLGMRCLDMSLARAGFISRKSSHFVIAACVVSQMRGFEFLLVAFTAGGGKQQHERRNSVRILFLDVDLACSFLLPPLS